MEPSSPAARRRRPNAQDVYLGAVVAVCDALTGGWLAAPDGHLDGVHDQFGADVVSDRPADNPTAPGVHHDGEVDLSFVAGMLGDVHDPEPVRCIDGELPLDQALGRRGSWIPPGAPSPALAAVNPHDPGLSHQPLDPLA
jgi:hypothetical protein